VQKAPDISAAKNVNMLSWVPGIKVIFCTVRD